MKESEVQKAIIDYLRTIGAWVKRLNSGVVFSSYTNKAGITKDRAIRLSEEGTPDVLCGYQGSFYLFEIKRDRKEAEKWMKVVKQFVQVPLVSQKNREQQRMINQYKEMLRAAKQGFQCYLVQSVDDVEAIINGKEPEFYCKITAVSSSTLGKRLGVDGNPQDYELPLPNGD